MYKQRTNSEKTISLIELKVYHNKIRRTESYSRYIVNLKCIVIETADSTKNIFEDELEPPREQVGSADPLVLPPLAASFCRDLLLAG